MKVVEAIEKGNFTEALFKQLQDEATQMALLALRADKEWREAISRHVNKQQ
jgi:hypothetical protein